MHVSTLIYGLNYDEWLDIDSVLNGELREKFPDLEFAVDDDANLWLLTDEQPDELTVSDLRCRFGGMPDKPFIHKRPGHANTHPISLRNSKPGTRYAPKAKSRVNARCSIDEFVASKPTINEIHKFALDSCESSSTLHTGVNYDIYNAIVNATIKAAPGGQELCDDLRNYANSSHVNHVTEPELQTRFEALSPTVRILIWSRLTAECVACETQEKIDAVPVRRLHALLSVSVLDAFGVSPHTQKG